MLIAVDGTESANWVTASGSNSSVYKFCSDYRGIKKYLNGPASSDGLLSVDGIVDEAIDFFGDVPEGVRWRDGLDLVGHSRGGLVVIRFAKKLRTKYPAAFIRFMGLYDAVDRCAWGTGSDVVTENVKLVVHARRNPKAKSRTSFGNCGVRGGQKYVQGFFMGTHSAIGGDPWGGDKPKGLDQIADTKASALADAFVRKHAASVNVPL